MTNLRNDILNSVGRQSDQSSFQIANDIGQGRNSTAVLLELNKMVNDGLVTKARYSVYNLTHAGANEARQSLVASMAMLDPTVMETEKLRLLADVDPDAAKQALVAAFMSDPNVEELVLNQELLDWCAQNEQALVAASIAGRERRRSQPRAITAAAVQGPSGHPTYCRCRNCFIKRAPLQYFLDRHDALEQKHARLRQAMRQESA